MDATFRPRYFSADLFSYAENKKIFEIFQNILESFTIDRPEKPLPYLYDLLTKRKVYNVPKVYILGPSSTDRTLVCTSLALKLGLMHITYESLMELQDETVPNVTDWSCMVKKRTELPDCSRCGWILEALPKNRTEAFFLRKRGIFPSHIVLIEPSDMMEINVYEMPKEMQDYLSQKSLILDFHRNGYIKTFTMDADVDDAIYEVIEFVRSKQLPPMPYLPRVLILGPYGSGRKTVAKKLAQKYNLIEVNYQTELRKAAMKDSSTKQKILEVLRSSSPVPDDLLVNVVSERLLQKDCIDSGWVMYNFPDAAAQAELLAKALEGYQINRAIFLDASLKVCIERVEPRRLDPVTGKMYHLKDDDITEKDSIKRKFIQLPQDAVESVEAEYKLYSANVEQLKTFFRQALSDDIAVEVDADASEAEVFESVQGAILKSSKMKLLIEDF